MPLLFLSAVLFLILVLVEASILLGRSFNLSKLFVDYNSHPVFDKVLKSFLLGFVEVTVKQSVLSLVFFIFWCRSTLPFLFLVIRDISEGVD